MSKCGDMMTMCYWNNRLSTNSYINVTLVLRKCWKSVANMTMKMIKKLTNS